MRQPGVAASCASRVCLQLATVAVSTAFRLEHAAHVRHGYVMCQLPKAQACGSLCASARTWPPHCREWWQLAGARGSTLAAHPVVYAEATGPSRRLRDVWQVMQGCHASCVCLARQNAGTVPAVGGHARRAHHRCQLHHPSQQPVCTLRSEVSGCALARRPANTCASCHKGTTCLSPGETAAAAAEGDPGKYRSTSETQPAVQVGDDKVLKILLMDNKMKSIDL